MAELTLKDESVIDIGQAVGERVQSIAQSGTGTAIVPAGGVTAPAAVAEPMNPFDSVMGVLSEIRDGIYSLVDKFAEGNSLEKQQMQQQEMAQDLSQVAGDNVAPPTDGAGGDDKSFLEKGKDKVKELMGAGGLKGLLIKGGLIAGLLLLAKGLQKYGKQIAEVVAPILDFLKNFVVYVGGDLLEFGGDLIGYVKDAFTGISNFVKGIFSGDGELIKTGLVELLALPAKFVSMIGTLVANLTESFFKLIGVDPAPEWVQNFKQFFTDLPEKAKEFFKGLIDFFTVTIPQKIQEGKDIITNWFTDSVTNIKQFFTDVGKFFTETIPTKLTEAYNNVTTFFTDLVGGVKGFFTDAFDFVTVTIPDKIGEITKGISDKFTEIKDQIINFAMAPFRKIGELFDNLLIGILESVENIPFIGGKAKEMKEAIIAKRETAAAEGEVNQIETGNLIDYGFDNNNNLTMNGDPVVMGTNSDAKEVAVAAINDGILKEDEAQILPVDGGFMVKRIVPATIEQGDTTTGGATGGSLNNESAEFVGAGNPTGGGNNSVVLGGNSTNNVSTISNTNVTEDTGPDDKFLKDSIYP